MVGDDGKDIVSTTDDLSIFKDKKVYIRACDSGKNLGPEIVKNGGAGFVGYKESFVFVHQPESFLNPISDEVAGFCLVPSNIIAEALIRGSTTKEAHEKGIEASQKILEKLETSSPYNSQFAPFVFWNMINQVCY